MRRLAGAVERVSGERMALEREPRADLVASAGAEQFDLEEPLCRLVNDRVNDPAITRSGSRPSTRAR